MNDTINNFSLDNNSYFEGIFLRFILPLCVLFTFYILITRRLQNKKDFTADIKILKQHIEKRKTNVNINLPLINSRTKKKLKNKRIWNNIELYFSTDVPCKYIQLYDELISEFNRIL